MFFDTPEDKVAECKTEKSKHLQQWKNFGTAGKDIEKNFSTCFVALNDRKKIPGISCGLHCQKSVEGHRCCLAVQYFPCILLAFHISSSYLQLCARMMSSGVV